MGTVPIHFYLQQYQYQYRNTANPYAPLNWKTYILNVKNKANKTLGFIKRNLHSCPG